MKTLFHILQQMQTDTEADIPALLTAAGLVDFHEYVIGPSREHNRSALCLYNDEMVHDIESNRLTLIVQLQLPGIEIETAAKYSAVVFEYFRTYKPARLGMNMLDSIAVDTWPMDNTRVTFVYLTLAYTEQLDSCDGGLT